MNGGGGGGRLGFPIKNNETYTFEKPSNGDISTAWLGFHKFSNF